MNSVIVGQLLVACNFLCQEGQADLSETPVKRTRPAVLACPPFEWRHCGDKVLLSYTDFHGCRMRAALSKQVAFSLTVTEAAVPLLWARHGPGCCDSKNTCRREAAHFVVPRKQRETGRVLGRIEHFPCILIMP